MRKTFSFTLLLVLAVVLLACSGCGKLRRKKSGIDDPNVIGSVGLTDVDSMALGDERFGEGSEVYAGQFSPVGFQYDSHQIEASERYKVDAVAEIMQSDGAVRLVVEGHCDERGSREYNMALGEHRALAVRAYLVGLGIDSDRIQTKSYGEENPAAYGHDDASWTQNRRAEFMLLN